jgi:uncharacterized protein with FMN-binding domain
MTIPRHVSRTLSFAMTLVLAAPAMLRAQQTPPPPAAPAAPRAAARPVADGVYIFEYGGYQSMFVVDPEGVLVTDPSAPPRPKPISRKSES